MTITHDDPTLDSARKSDTDDADTSALVLSFNSDGIAELTEDDELVWTSDDDENYSDSHLTVADAVEILNYLEAQEFLDEDEKALVQLESEPLVIIRTQTETETEKNAAVETDETSPLPPATA